MNGFWHSKICQASYEKCQTTSDGRNGTIKSRQDYNIRRQGTVQILRRLGGRHHQTNADERKNKKDYLGIILKLLVTKLCCRNLIKWINIWAVSIVRYSGPFLKWTRDELMQMDQKTTKLMTMHKTLHPRDDVDRLYVSRKQGGRRLPALKQRWRIDTTTRGLHRISRKRTVYNRQKRYEQNDGQLMETTRKQNGNKTNPMGVLND